MSLVQMSLIAWLLSVSAGLWVFVLASGWQMHHVDLWVMLGFSLALIPWMLRRRAIGRGLGATVVTALVIYVTSLIIFG